MARRILLLVLVLATLTTTHRAQGVRIAETQAREWAAYAASKANGDPKIFDERFRDLVRIVAPSFWADPFTPMVTAHRSDELMIWVSGPVTRYAAAASEAVRKMEPLPAVPWIAGVSVLVDPSQIDAPDIERVVVKRDGVEVAPLVTTLTVRPLTTRIGTTRQLHAGSVVFPESAFASGAQVVLIAIPASGMNIIVTLSPESLRMVV